MRNGRVASRVLAFAALAKNFKLLVLLVMLALVPLRALAAVTSGLCADYHGGASAPAHQHHHGHAAAGGDAQAPAGEGNVAAACSLCTTCCTGAAFAPDAPRATPLARADLSPIPFFARGPGAHVPDGFDRPPLAR